MPGLDQAALTRLFQFARARGVKTVLDVAGVHAARGLEPFEQVLPHTDVFLPNDDEARAITGESDPLRQAEIFASCGAGTVVVTLGAKGAVARSGDQVLRASAFRVNVVDLLRRGRRIDAGFIVGMLEGWDLPRTLEFASAIGASACTALGCTAGVFTREQALAYLRMNHIAVD